MATVKSMAAALALKVLSLILQASELIAFCHARPTHPASNQTREKP